jgi:hypothetical protein
MEVSRRPHGNYAKGLEIVETGTESLMGKKPISQWRRLVKAKWPSYYWIQGDGRYAVVNPCRYLTVELFETRDEALKRFRLYQRIPCGGQCWRSCHLMSDLKTDRTVYDKKALAFWAISM